MFDVLMTNDHRICEREDSIKAILDGRKIQTRKVIYPQPELDPDGAKYGMGGFWWASSKCLSMVTVEQMPCLCPYGQIGNKLWVPEPWLLYNHLGTFVGSIPKQRCSSALSVGYKVDGLDPENIFGWRPSITMSKWAARIWLEITDIRVERVRDITDKDALAEGIITTYNECQFPPVPWYTYSGAIHQYVFPRVAFEHLWDTINAKRGYGWDIDPWVWVLTFKKISLY